MKAADYTPQVFTRIRNGATARELGWDDQFYLTVCRRHGIAPNTRPSQTHIPPTFAIVVPTTGPLSPAARLAAAQQDWDERMATLAPVAGPCIFDNTSGTLTRSGHCITLTPRRADVFALLIKATSKHPANGKWISEHLQMTNVTGVAGHIMGLRDKLVLLNIKIETRIGRENAGYWLADASTRAPIKFRITGAAR